MRQETISRIANFIAAGIAFVKPVKAPSEAVKQQDIPNSLGNLSPRSLELLQTLVKLLPIFIHPGKLILPQYVVGNDTCYSRTIIADRLSPELKKFAAETAREAAAKSNSEFAAYFFGGYELPESLRHKERAILDKHGSIKNYPGKSEVVFIHLATRHGHYTTTVTVWPKIRRELEQLSWEKCEPAQEHFLEGMLPAHCAH